MSLLLCAMLLQQLAVRGETVHTMAGAALEDAVVLIRDGTIERVGPASEVPIPAGVRVLTARVVTPGLIDAHCALGLSGQLNQPHDQDQLEKSAPILPELRAIDAFNPRERLIDWVQQYGVTTIHTGHIPGALFAGQTLIAKTAGGTVEAAVTVPVAMVVCALGESGLDREDRKSPGTRAKAVALLRAELVKAQEYAKKRAAPDADKRPAQNLELDVLVRVLARELPLLVTAHRSQDLLTALRVQQEFGFRMVLDGAAEAYLVADQIKAANVPVILHSTMYRAGGETENLSFTTASKLKQKGILVALQGSFEGYVPKARVVLFEAALAAANGLSFDDALATITRDAAVILGVDQKVGTLAPGKDADLALFDGDPFEYTTHVTGVVIRGAVVRERGR